MFVLNLFVYWLRFGLWVICFGGIFVVRLVCCLLFVCLVVLDVGWIVLNWFGLVFCLILVFVFYCLVLVFGVGIRRVWWCSGLCGLLVLGLVVRFAGLFVILVVFELDVDYV